MQGVDPKAGKLHSCSVEGYWNWAFEGQKPKECPYVQTIFCEVTNGKKKNHLALSEKGNAGRVSALPVNPPPPNQTNQLESWGKQQWTPHLSQVCDWLQNTVINHPNKHLKSKSKAIKTLLTLSLLPQANHKCPEFITFARRREEDLRF